MNYINPNAPAAGLTRLLNMRDNNPATQLAYVPTKDIAAMGSMGGLEFNPYSGIPQARGIAAVADGGSIQNAPLAPVADELASRGRYGDSMLLHVRPDELQGLASLGTLTINPDTGLPEAFSFKSLLPVVGGIAGSILLGPAFGAAFGKGALATAFGTGVGAGLGSFAGGLAAGQSPGQAALGGLMSGATAGFMQGLAPGLEAATPGLDSAGGSAITDISGQGFVEGATQQAITTNVPSSLTAAGAPQSFIDELSKVPATSFSGETLLSAYGPNTPSTLGVSGISTPVGTATGLQDTFVAQKAVERGPFSKFLGAEDIAKGQRFTRPEALAEGYIPSDITIPERAGQVLTDPKTYVGAGISTMLQPPPEMEYQEPEPLTFSSYTPRERTLAGGVQSPARSSEEYLRMALEGGYQPLSEQYRYAAQGGLVGLEEGGQPSSLTAMSITPESQRVRNDTSQPQQNISNRFFDELESKGGIMSIMSRLLLRNNPEAIQFVNQNVSSPRNLQLNEMGAGRHSYFDTADTGLYPKAAGGLVRLVEGGTPEQGVLQPQLSPVLQQQQTPMLQQQEQQISERARQDELLQRDQAMSRGQQFIEQPTGNQQLFQQMQAAGQVIGQQLAQGPEAYATPAGGKAPSTSFSTGADFGFNAGGLVGLAQGGGVDNSIAERQVSVRDYLKSKGLRDEAVAGIMGNIEAEAPSYRYDQIEKTKNKVKGYGLFQFTGPRKTAYFNWLGKNNQTDSAESQIDYVMDHISDTRKEMDKSEYDIGSGNRKTLRNAFKDGSVEDISKKFMLLFERPKDQSKEKIEFRQEQALNAFGRIPELDEVPTPKAIESALPQIEEESILDKLASLFGMGDKSLKVGRGDTLSQIAEREGVSVKDIAEASGIQDINKIQAGQELTIPSQGLLSMLGFAQGGEIGKYFEGQVVGNGDGMSDQILFEVEGNNPDKALLSRDEYVIPADVVAMLGNGSSNAGSEQLDSFIKGIRQDSFGTQEQQRQLNAQQGLRGLV